MADIDHGHDVIYPPYVVYTADSITAKKADGALMAVNYSGLTGYIRWVEKYFSSWDHIEFYAACDGWDLLTGTGYRSFIVPHETDTTEALVRDWFTAVCSDCFPVNHQHQHSLF